MYVVYRLGFANLRPIGFVEAGRFATKSAAMRCLNKIREMNPDHADSYWDFIPA